MESHTNNQQQTNRRRPCRKDDMTYMDPQEQQEMTKYVKEFKMQKPKSIIEIPMRKMMTKKELLDIVFEE